MLNLAKRWYHDNQNPVKLKKETLFGNLLRLVANCYILVSSIYGGGISMTAKSRPRRRRIMAEKVDADGRIQVTARLLPEEVRQLDALKQLMERSSRSNVASFGLKAWMRDQLSNPETAQTVAELTAQMMDRTAGTKEAALNTAGENQALRTRGLPK
jgi:hypothetical protein